MDKKGSRSDRRKVKKTIIRLQERDENILKALYAHRFLSSVHLTTIIEGSKYVILRRLKNLWRSGYLDRPQKQPAFFNPNQPMIYALGNRGADYLSQHLGIHRRKIDWRTKNTEVGDSHINHTLMIANFRIILALALEKEPDIELFWSNKTVKELRDRVFLPDGRDLPINPDAFFGIERMKSKLFFFLEADRSSEKTHLFLNKMKAYFQYWDQKKCAEKYHFKNFKVLTITKSPERADNLRKLSKKADPPQKGFPGFWFVTDRHYTLENPQTILKPIWQTPANNTFHSLLEEFFSVGDNDTS